MIKNQDLYNSLKELKLIEDGLLEDLYEETQDSDENLYSRLLEKNLISEEDLARLVSDFYETKFVDLDNTSIDKDVLKLVPELVARKQLIIPFKRDSEGLHVAMYDPDNKEIVRFLQKKIGDTVIIYNTTKSAINNAFSLYSKDIADELEKYIAKSEKYSKETGKESASIIKVVDILLKYAYQNNASDVHIEPEEDESVIRFRIDGILHDVVKLPSSLHDQVVTRVKVLAKLRIDEHQKAQDGKINIKIEGRPMDVRVSVVPITQGEKVVMRILSEKSRKFSLSDLGLAEKDLKKVEKAYKKPHGMILSTGPTGSGKTTTLYAVLKLLNSRDVNVMTIEDPVEYDIEGVNQIQVNTKTDLTFSKGLRSIVRQDPDIILVGEIRDEETADIVVNAAMTGHLVLSSMHTNDAATTIPRFLDLGVEPFLIGSTVNVIIAQRLVRKICESCRYSVEHDLQSENKKSDDTDSGKKSKILNDLLKKYFKGEKKVTTYQGKGCQVCHDTGYLGRVGIFEVLVIDDVIREAILTKKDANQIRELAIKEGMSTMIEDGMEKVKQGITTIEEIIRVTKD